MRPNVAPLILLCTVLSCISVLVAAWCIPSSFYQYLENVPAKVLLLLLCWIAAVAVAFEVYYYLYIPGERRYVITATNALIVFASVCCSVSVFGGKVAAQFEQKRSDGESSVFLGGLADFSGGAGPAIVNLAVFVVLSVALIFMCLIYMLACYFEHKRTSA